MPNLSFYGHAILRGGMVMAVLDGLFLKFKLILDIEYGFCCIKQYTFKWDLKAGVDY